MRSPLRLVVVAFALVSCADTRVAPSWPGSHVLVAEDGALAVIEPNSGRVRDRLEAPRDARAVAVSADGRYAAAFGADGDVVVVDLVERRTDARFRPRPSASRHVHGAPSGVDFADRRSTLLTSFAASGAIDVVSRDSGEPQGTITSDARGIGALTRAPDGRRYALLRDAPDGADWIEIDAPTRRGASTSAERVDAIAPTDAAGVVWHHASGETTVRRSSAAGAEIAIEVGAPPFELAAIPDSTRAAVTAAASGELVVLDAATSSVVARVFVGAPDAARAWSLLVDPDGRHAYVAVRGEDRVAVVDLATSSVRGSIATGRAPGAMAFAFRRADPRDSLLPAR